MLLFFVLTICIVTPVTNAVDRKYNALQFGTTTNDYISFNYDMSPFRTSLTLCTWIKRVYTSSSYPVVFNYQTSSSSYEILTASEGEYNRVLGDGVLDNSHSKFTTPVGQWFHYCLTWSSSSRTIQLYLDGELAASGQTSSGRALHGSGTVWFGNIYYVHRSHIFGGQLYRFNLYNEILSSETIKRIADGGLCAEVEETISSRQLRWEDVLAKSRTGSVVEVTACEMLNTIAMKEELDALKEELNAVTRKLNVTEDDLHTVTANLNRTKDELIVVTSELNSTQEELQTVTGRLNRTVDVLERTRVSLDTETTRRNRTEEELSRTKVSLESEVTRRNRTEEELSRTKVILESVTGRCNQTKEELQRTKVSLESEVTRSNTCSAELTDTKSQLKGARKFSNITKWDILYTEPYFNNVFSKELLDDLKSSCKSLDLLDEFVGVNLTDNVIDHFRKHDVNKAECGEQRDIFDLFDEFIGVKLTRGIIKHLRSNHNDEPCDD